MKSKIPLIICVSAGLLALPESLRAKGGHADKEDDATAETAEAGKGKKKKDGGGGKSAENNNDNNNNNKKQNAEPKQDNSGKHNPDKPSQKQAESNPDKPKKSDSSGGKNNNEDKPKKSAKGNDGNDGPNSQNQDGKKHHKQDDGPNLSDNGDKDKKNQNKDSNNNHNDDSSKNKQNDSNKNKGDGNDKIVEDNSKSNSKKNVDIDNKEKNVKNNEDKSKNVDINNKEKTVKNVDNSKVDKSHNKTEINNVTNVNNIDRRPGKNARPARVERRQEWAEVEKKNSNNWNSWHQQNNVHVEKFQQERTQRWSQVSYHNNNWPQHYHDNNYNAWRHNVWDYRRDRAVEIWDHRQEHWDDAFDDHWWGYAAWRPAPRVYVNVSPWWWWRPLAWSNVNVFFHGSVAASPVVYDPGTTVIYEGDNYYVDGESRGSAVAARQSARALAYPQVAAVPIPEPAENGQDEEWQPLGVWTLTQQEKGDANMFMQLSVNRDGLIGGAYKNIMTGDEQPIVGQLDKKSQRLAWHVGEATETVYETGLSNLENDVASVFVHLGETETQTWLLVRLPSPEIPPSTVKIPDYVAQN